MSTARDAVAGRYGERTLTSLDDFLEHSEMAARLVALGREQFFADEFAMLASEAVAIRLGESVGRVDKDFLTDHPELGLRPILSTRHVIAHGYDIVDHSVLWNAFENELPATANAVRRFLENDSTDAERGEPPTA